MGHQLNGATQLGRPWAAVTPPFYGGKPTCILHKGEEGSDGRAAVLRLAAPGDRPQQIVRGRSHGVVVREQDELRRARGRQAAWSSIGGADAGDGRASLSLVAGAPCRERRRQRCTH